MSARVGSRFGRGGATALVMAYLATVSLWAGQAPSPRAPAPAVACRVAGHVVAGTTSLPGVAVLARLGGQVVGVTSTDPTGAYRLRLTGTGPYRLQFELAGFALVERAVTDPTGACDVEMDVELQLESRAVNRAANQGVPGPGRGNGAAGAGGGRFQALGVALDDVLTDDLIPEDTIDPAAQLLLPPGFSVTDATDTLTVQGDGASLDRGLMRERLQALARGEFDRVGGVLPAGLPLGRAGGFGGAGLAALRGGAGGQGGGPAGRGSGVGFLGRGLRGQSRYQGATTYTFGGSVLDAAPYPLRADARTERDYTQQQLGTSFGGPLRIPGVYDGARTSFFLDVSGDRSTDLRNQYATVPSAAVRSGDFGESAVVVRDPVTGGSFPDNRIPADRIDPVAQSLLQYLPTPNLPGEAQNYQTARTAQSSGETLSLRVTHNFTGTPAAGRGGRGFGRGGFRGRGGGASGTAVVLNAQVQVRRSESDVLGVFPSADGVRSSTGLTVPVTVNVLHGGLIHNVQVNVSRTRSETVNGYAGVEDVAGRAGIAGVSSDPFAWGIPSLSFSSYTSLQDVTPSRRHDRRLRVAYTGTRPTGRHRIRFGAEVSRDVTRSLTDANARGSFVFTGFYAGGRAPVSTGAGLDFADFLLGLPQQASVQYGPGEVTLRSDSLGLFVQDTWRKNAGLTLNLGLRYELVRPFQEADGRMVGLDVAPDFTAAVPVFAGTVGPYSGLLPLTLVRTDTNNLAPRLGVAWRATPNTVVRTGYGISFNSGSYASVARQLVAQPPFAVTDTVIGALEAPIVLADPFATSAPDATTNTYGIDPGYQLGFVQTWNLDVDRDLMRGWSLGVGYTGTKGASLDILRAPNRDPDGLRIDGVSPFLWQSSEGTSILQAGTLRLRRRQSNGIGGSLSYTVAKSIDNASSIGGGGSVVAQDDRNLEAERGLSSFDRRHQLSASLFVEFPFGEGRRWLDRGGWVAALAGGWALQATVTAESGNPYTARVVGSASEVVRGTSGTLRADSTGVPAALDAPTLLRYFQTDAFGVPAPGTFGNVGRNTIIGPGGGQLNAVLTRDVRLGGNRVISLRLNASNLFNTVQYAGIDTVVNSPTVGQVVSVRPMRRVRLNLRLRF